MTAPVGLVGQVRRLVVVVAALQLRAPDTEESEQAVFELAEQVEEPDAEGDLQIDEVEETDPGKAEGHGQVDHVAPQPDRRQPEG